MCGHWACFSHHRRSPGCFGTPRGWGSLRALESLRYLCALRDEHSTSVIAKDSRPKTPPCACNLRIFIEQCARLQYLCRLIYAYLSNHNPTITTSPQPNPRITFPSVSAASPLPPPHIAPSSYLIHTHPATRLYSTYPQHAYAHTLSSRTELWFRWYIFDLFCSLVLCRARFVLSSYPLPSTVLFCISILVLLSRIESEGKLEISW